MKNDINAFQKWLLIVLNLILLNNYVHAQNDSIADGILQFSEPRNILISKGRALLTNYIAKDDINKIRDIRAYLNHQLSDKRYLALYPIENWLIGYLVSDYNDLVPAILKIDSIYEASQSMIYPQDDRLLITLIEKAYERRLLIAQSVKKSTLSDDDKDFLLLYLNIYFKGLKFSEIDQDFINKLADSYLKKYADHDRKAFIRSKIRINIVQSDWGLGFDFFSGHGSFSGQLRRHYSNIIPIGVAFDVAYKRATLYLRNFIGLGRIRHDFVRTDVVWKKNSQMRVFLPEASMGYDLYENNKIKITPFAGFSSMDITPTDHDIEKNGKLEKFELSFTTTYTIGINFDFKIQRSGLPLVTSSGMENNYIFIRMRYGYNFPQFSKYYPGNSGHMQYVAIGIGGFGRKLSRER